MYKYRTNSGTVTLGNTASRSQTSRHQHKPTSRQQYKKPSRSRSRNILDESTMTKSAIPQEDRIEIPQHSFTDFSFPEAILNNLNERGYVTPSPIQDKAIKPILERKDVVGLAATGTGKTAAFLLPLLTHIIEDKNHKSLIIAPTRELALQIADEFNKFSLRTYVYSAVCVGGMPIHHQIKDLRRNHNIVIGTPGRLKDLSERGHIVFSSFDSVVLDEVDHMLDMGFVDEITAILDQLPSKRQSLFFSATMPDRIRRLIEKYTHNPEIIEISSGKTTDNVEQSIIKVDSKEKKVEILNDILNQSDSEKVLIFTETKIETDELAHSLKERGQKVLSIHGDKHQRDRIRALNFFKENKVNVLVATDVAARGLDIPNVSHVINFTVPKTKEDYVHRIGRTGRASSMGIAITFIDKQQNEDKKYTRKENSNRPRYQNKYYNR